MYVTLSLNTRIQAASVGFPSEHAAMTAEVAQEDRQTDDGSISALDDAAPAPVKEEEVAHEHALSDEVGKVDMDIKLEVSSLFRQQHF